MTGAWAGHYDRNSFDYNAILGPSVAGIENYRTALVVSGHGPMQAPAVGCELLLHGRQRVLHGVRLHDAVPKA